MERYTMKSVSSESSHSTIFEREKSTKYKNNCEILWNEVHNRDHQISMCYRNHLSQGVLSIVVFAKHLFKNQFV